LFEHERKESIDGRAICGEGKNGKLIETVVSLKTVEPNGHGGKGVTPGRRRSGKDGKGAAGMTLAIGCELVSRICTGSGEKKSPLNRKAVERRKDPYGSLRGKSFLGNG